jgi:Domain of unknown function (DUF4365)
MELNDHKEQVSFAYVRAVAAVAGFGIIENPYHPDDDSIDVKFHSKTKRRAQLEAQLKCTACELVPNGATEIPFDLPTKNYNDLVVDVLTPRILIVVTVPILQADWCLHSEQELLLRRCGYFVSLAGREPSENKNTVRIKLPRANVLTPAKLTELMSKIDAGEPL